MDKQNGNSRVILTLGVLGVAVLLLLSCSLLSQPASSPTNTAAQPASGSPVSLGGKAAVSVSDGVIILTPGQPYPTQALDLGLFTPFPIDEAEAGLLEGTPTPASTVDIVSLSLPSGLTIYPGATDLQTTAADPSGAGLKYVTFHTSATPDQVINYYQQELARAGWRTLDQQTPTPKPNGQINFEWTIKGWLATLSLDIDPQGGTKVMIIWMKQ